VATFGREFSNDREQIGGVADIAIGDDGGFFVLDSRMNRVLAVAASGTLVATYGRPGAGPGEFRNPKALAFEPSDSSAYVLDQGLATVTILRWNGRAFAYDTSFRVSHFGYDLCVMGGLLYLYAPSDQATPVIQVLNRSGVVIRRFGQPFGDRGGPPLRMALRGGVVECVRPDRTVILASQLEPEVRAYSSEGELRWSRLLEDYSSVKILVTAGGGFMRDTTSNEPADFTYTVFSLAGGIVAVQVERYTAPGVDTESRLLRRVTTLVRVGSGEAIWRTETLPRLARVGRDLAYEFTNDPFPRVQVFRYRLGAVK
jgi:hypothetical protein